MLKCIYVHVQKDVYLEVHGCIEVQMYTCMLHFNTYVRVHVPVCVQSEMQKDHWCMLDLGSWGLAPFQHKYLEYKELS